jgi:hypothetical protein
VQAGGGCHFELGADAVGRGDQQGIAIAGLGQVEDAAKSADAGDDAGAQGGLGERIDGFDEAVTFVDIDAGVPVVKAVRIATVGNLRYPFATEDPLLN